MSNKEYSSTAPPIVTCSVVCSLRILATRRAQALARPDWVDHRIVQELHAIVASLMSGEAGQKGRRRKYEDGATGWCVRAYEDSLHPQPQKGGGEEGRPCMPFFTFYITCSPATKLENLSHWLHALSFVHDAMFNN